MGTVKEFAEVLEAAQAQWILDQGHNPENHNTEVRVVRGRKYTKVDIGSSGKYMVVNDTGEIFGIKAYGVIHRGHAYGTLDTIGEWDWRGYSAVRKPTITDEKHGEVMVEILAALQKAIESGDMTQALVNAVCFGEHEHYLGPSDREEFYSRFQRLLYTTKGQSRF